MRATRAVMGGGRRFFHPRYVWSPAGGYWNDGPVGAEKRAWMLFAGAALLTAAVAKYSASHEVRPQARIGGAGSHAFSRPTGDAAGRCQPRACLCRYLRLPLPPPPNDCCARDPVESAGPEEPGGAGADAVRAAEVSYRALSEELLARARECMRGAWHSNRVSCDEMLGWRSACHSPELAFE